MSPSPSAPASCSPRSGSSSLEEHFTAKYAKDARRTRRVIAHRHSPKGAGPSAETKSVCGATILGNQRGPPWPGLYLTTPHKCLWTRSCRSSTTEDPEKGPWIKAVRPSRRALWTLLRVRTFLNSIKVLPHAEERSQSASRRTHRQRCRLARSLFCVEPNSAARHDCPMQTYGKDQGLYGAQCLPRRLILAVRDLRHRQPRNCHSRIVCLRHRAPLSGGEIIE